MAKAMGLDAHQRPPESMRALFKRWQKSSAAVIEDDPDLIDFTQAIDGDRMVKISLPIAEADAAAIQSFANGQTFDDLPDPTDTVPTTLEAFEINALPGLFVLPSLLSPEVQIALLDRLLHRDLSCPAHKTNIHLHYDIPQPVEPCCAAESADNSFFSIDPGSLIIPKDEIVHKPISVAQMLQRKLRWVTLGGQYDWTAKVYPDTSPPPFPDDIKRLLKAVFPTIDAQAAIVNFYTPGDTLSVHRDVSEDCDHGLISISIGCDGIFIVGNVDGSKSATLRLRSGDALLMSGESRFAWHAVPKILPDTCPLWLLDWPASSQPTTYEHWRGWMAEKRINLNVRQMKSHPNLPNDPCDASEPTALKVDRNWQENLLV